jgi:heptosyltransferase-2
VIKLGALGDVLRTTPILRRLRAERPGCHVTWVAGGEAVTLLDGNPLVDRILSWGLETLVRLDAEFFHAVVNLDKAPEAAAMAVRLRAGRRIGFGLDGNGALIPLNPESGYAFRLGVDDELKFRENRKSYQEIAFEQMGWLFRGEQYVLSLGPGDLDWAENRMKRLGLGTRNPPVGLAVGAGAAFANKSLPPRRWASLARSIQERMGRPVLLLTGPGEADLAREASAAAGPWAPRSSGGDHSVRQFAALVGRCAAVVSGDTLAMHLAIAAGVPVVALFGPTCGQEVHLYGRGSKLVSPKACAPCYRRRCQEAPTCVEEIPEEAILAALQGVLAGPDSSGG